MIGNAVNEPPPIFVAQFGSAVPSNPGVKIENISGIRFRVPGGTPQQ